MQRTRSISATAAAVVLILGLSACGDSGGSSDAEIKDRIADQFVDDGLDQEAADCFADVIVDEIGADKLKDVDFSAEEPPAELAVEITSAGQKASDECDFSSIDG